MDTECTDRISMNTLTLLLEPIRELVNGLRPESLRVFFT